MSEDRRAGIVDALRKSSKAISASNLAKDFNVSRQIIVGDVALLRAAGERISATPKGYIFTDDEKNSPFGYVGIIACTHTFEQLKEELNTIVDFGGTIIDVIIEHSLYGQISGLLDISSRHDVDLFMERVSGNSDKPLYALTGGIHLHSIGCKDKESFSLIEKNLREKNILLK